MPYFSFTEIIFHLFGFVLFGIIWLLCWEVNEYKDVQGFSIAFVSFRNVALTCFWVFIFFLYCWLVRSCSVVSRIDGAEYQKFQWEFKGEVIGDYCIKNKCKIIKPFRQNYYNSGRVDYNTNQKVDYSGFIVRYEDKMFEYIEIPVWRSSSFEPVGWNIINKGRINYEPN